MERVTKSREDYLEAILMIREEKGYCFSVDIARRLSFSKPSVSVAIKNLERDGYIRRIENDIQLTETGHEIASRTLEKHRFFTEVLQSIGVSAAMAEHDACLIEHHISEESYRKVKACWEGRPHRGDIHMRGRMEERF